MKRLGLLLLAPLAASSLAPAMAQEGLPPQQQAVAAAARGQAVPPVAASNQAPASQASGGQWVSAGASGFPPSPSQVAAQTSQQKISAAFPTSNYGPGNYAVTGQGGTGAQNGVAPMPPLTPPGNLATAEQVISPFSSDEIIKLRKGLESSRKAKAYHPVRTVPRISSISLDLAPGSALPIARVMPGEQTTIVFVDSTGAPWPLAAAPRVSDNHYFDVEWLQDTPSIVISAMTSYEDGNIAVFLRGLATPVIVKLATGEPDSSETSRVVDYRLDIRVPGRGPNAKAPLIGPGRIALYDDTMQAFLDGIPPKDATRVKVHGAVPARTQIWQLGDAMFVRTSDDIQSAFDESISAADGTRVYRLPPTPYITLSEAGRAVTLQLDVN
ncbi:Vesicle coat complex COPII, subunit SEC24/subunit SFB2/subunit SFB3 [Burkholderia diffusa]|uniref:DotH/IcmK family type IV secretion protein n=1 Tax=Burkholderia diffusa TaxID=488732 RepID=UPI001CAD48B0|nr:DotH/IcmK family type IV secretion protein [Burkholderia diffusa]CAG9260885.1 Vesicle coat complex COPII, subunit SEC24/subunit SFB2/subunit SFB3 [Burkholderia diffusa]